MPNKNSPRVYSISFNISFLLNPQNLHPTQKPSSGKTVSQVRPTSLCSLFIRQESSSYLLPSFQFDLSSKNKKGLSFLKRQTLSFLKCISIPNENHPLSPPRLHLSSRLEKSFFLFCPFSNPAKSPKLRKKQSPNYRYWPVTI